MAVCSGCDDGVGGGGVTDLADTDTLQRLFRAALAGGCW